MAVKNNYCVYKHTTPSGKAYVGITKQLPRKRWKNGKGYDLCTAFARAIQKYGWSNIQHEIIANGLTEQEACELEKQCIAMYDSANPEHGYNLTHGGEHYEPNEEWRCRASEAHRLYYSNHPEAKTAISVCQKGRKARLETRQKMSESRKKYIAEHPETRELCRNTFLGKKRSVENCEKLRLANIQSVMCLETGETFESVERAALSVGVCRAALSNHLTGRSKSCGGRHFVYAT